MFVHQSRLKHVLPAQAYWSPEQFALEQERLMQPTWHLVGTQADMPNDGDYLTLDLLDRPLLVRNFGGQYHAFLNVCGHRHSMLTCEARGHSDHLRCQYHGWEYNKDGRTAKIPEAKCFAPWERDRAHLQKFRAQVCGQLIFVSLSDDGPDLEEFLGESFERLAQAFDHPWRQCWAWERELPANWKLVVENSLETYHLSSIHAKTFGENPAEEFCEHELLGDRSTFTLDINYHQSNGLQDRALRWLGSKSTGTYMHHHVFPAFISTQSDIFRMAQSVWPTAPDRCRTIVRLFAFRGDRTNPLVRLIAYLASRFGAVETEKIIMEDVDLLPSVQRGVQCAIHPGVLGTREERLFTFQQYVADHCSPPSSSREFANSYREINR